MPSKSWNGDSASSKLTIQYDGFTQSGGYGYITNPKLVFYSASGWSDSTNTLKAKGAAVYDKTWSNHTYNGGTDTFVPTASPVQLRYGGTTASSFQAEVTGISFFNGDGSTDTYTLNIDYPAIPYNAPYAPSNVALLRVNDSTQRCTFAGNQTNHEADRYTETVDWVYQVDSEAAAWQTGAYGLPGTTDHFDLNGCAANHRYRVAVRFWNATGGVSAWTYSTWIYTTPAAPTNQAVSRYSDTELVIDCPLASAPYRSGFAAARQENNAGGYVDMTVFPATTLLTDSAAPDTSSWQYALRNYVAAQPLYGGGSVDLYSATVYTALVVALPDTPGVPVPKRKTAADGTTSLAWTLAGTAAGPVKPYVTQDVQYQQGAEDGSAVNVGIGFGPTVTTTEHATAVNSRYRYRVRAVNATGSSAWSAWSAWIATKPSAPTVGVPAKSGATTVIANWTNTAPYRTGSKLGWSEDGGAEFDPAIAAAPADSSAARTVDAAKTHKYRVYHVAAAVPLLTGGTTDLVSDGSDWSELIQLQAPPLAPTVTITPNLVDAAITAITISVTHRPVDASAQTDGEVRGRVVGAPTWDVFTLGTATSTVMPPGTLANGYVYEIQARTKGADASFGPWSSSKNITTSGTPTASITSPADTAVIDGADLAIELAFTDPDGAAVSMWDLRVKDGAGTVIWSASSLPGSISAAPYLVAAVTLEDAHSYTVEARGRNAAGLWSAWDTSAITVDYAEPPEVLIESAVWDPDLGRVVIEIVNPTPGPGQVAPVSQDLQWFRDGLWLPVATDLQVLDGQATQIVVDPIAPSGQLVRYRMVTRTDIPSVATGTPFEVQTSPSDGWIYLNGGPGWATLAKVRGRASETWDGSREKTLITPLGRTGPIELLGEQRSSKWKVAGSVAKRAMQEHALGTRGPWKAISDVAAPICLRDWNGTRVFCSIDAVSIDHVAGTVSATLTEVDYVEPQ